MIRRLQRLATGERMVQGRILSRRKCLLQALLAIFSLNLFVSNPSVWAEESTMVAAAPVEAAEIIKMAEETKFLRVPLWDNDIYKMVVRFTFDLFFLLLVVGVAYSPNNRKNQRYIFNFLIMNIVVFFICFTLKKLELELGMALGLFAIFAIIRYRTDQIDVKDMTYLFVVIGLAVINALSNRKTSYVELVFTNAMIFGACLFMERFLGPAVVKVKLTRSEVVYDKLDLLRPENVKELYEDIYQRTGIRADRVEIKQIDFKNGTSLIDVRQSKERAFVHQDEIAKSNEG